MSLIPFILDLADELHEYNRYLASATGGGAGSPMDVDDFGFGIYPHELQQRSPPLSPLAQQQQQQSPNLRRPRTFSQFPFWLSNSPTTGNTKLRHHPYRSGSGCGSSSSSSSNTVSGKACCNKFNSSAGGQVLEIEKESTNLNTITNSNPSPNTNTNINANTNTPNGITGTGVRDVTSKSSYSVVNRSGFQVSMNVKQFAPDELTVKTIDNCIVVEGRHEDKEDGHGVISRHFIRKYTLPKGYDPNEVHSTLSSDGILTVKAPPPPSPKTGQPLERVVQIQPASLPAVGTSKIMEAEKEIPPVDAEKMEKKKLQQPTQPIITEQTPVKQPRQQEVEKEVEKEETAATAVAVATTSAEKPEDGEKRMETETETEPLPEIENGGMEEKLSKQQAQQNGEQLSAKSAGEIAENEETEMESSSSSNGNSNTNTIGAASTSSNSALNTTATAAASMPAMVIAIADGAVDSVVVAAVAAETGETNFQNIGQTDANANISEVVVVSTNGTDNDSGNGNGGTGNGENASELTNNNNNNSTNNNTNNPVAGAATIAVTVAAAAIAAENNGDIVVDTGKKTVSVTTTATEKNDDAATAAAAAATLTGTGCPSTDGGAVTVVAGDAVTVIAPPPPPQTAAIDLVAATKMQCENGNGATATAVSVAVAVPAAGEAME